MGDNWSYRDWRPGGERTQLGDIIFDSTIHCGNGHNFHQVGENHYKFRARTGLAHYSWRHHFLIESPGDGREVTLEVADFNHFGQELWQEAATVVSHDGESWRDLGLESMEITGWSGSGYDEDDATIDDGWHPPYGVKYRLRLDAPRIWFASPTPYTLDHSARMQHALAARCDFFKVHELGPASMSDRHGHQVLMTEVSRGVGDGDKLRVLVVAGEHAAESAGMYAAEGVLEELLRQVDLLRDFIFFVVPVVNVDGVAFGRSYHNIDSADPVGPGSNLARDWRDRSEPETHAVWRVVERLRPHAILNLHNGRHRRRFEVWAPLQPNLSTMLRHLREHLPVPVDHWRPYVGSGSLPEAAVGAGLTDLAVCLETLLLRKMPGCDDFPESYKRVGRFALRAVVSALREVHGLPQMDARAEELSTQALRCRPKDFSARLPWFYYSADFAHAAECGTHNLEINGLPVIPGYYDVWLHVGENRGDPDIRIGGERCYIDATAEGWLLLPSMAVPGRMVSFDYTGDSDEPPFDEMLIAPEGTPISTAQQQAAPYTRYIRRIGDDEKDHLRDWERFHCALMRGGFDARRLRRMHDQIVDWVASRQVVDQSDEYYGASWSEEDKYDARDTAAAAACFAMRYARTGEREWLARASAAREYVYRNQMHEPENSAHDGGFVHMVSGIWGTQFRRLEPPLPGIDGVDTGVIVQMLCKCIELGLPAAERDLDVIEDAARWIAANEALPGLFLHHEGATRDCQNATAIGLSALVRAWHTLRDQHRPVPDEWLQAAHRGIKHYVEGQEAIGVWPYNFAQVGTRGQAYSFENIPDHGIGLHNLTRALHLPPLADREDVADALKRAARWYLCVCRLDGDTIDLEYDTRPDLGGGICFSGFTWCRFTAASALTRIARYCGEPEPWRSLALRLMEHVQRKLWQTDDPDRAPVVAHVRPEAPLATWCQAVEWDAVMLAEMIEDLQAMGEG